MKKFEYKITKHSGEELRKTIYFCSDAGECGLEEIPNQEIDFLKRILDEQGNHGWELIQFIFGKNGIMAFWKRIPL